MKDEIYDNDVIKDYFEKLNDITEKEIKLTEENLNKQIELINNYLKEVENNLQKAEEEGDENLYNVEIIKKQLVLQKLSELQTLSSKIKKRR